MKELSLAQIREIQIDLLKKFHEICIQNELCYSMCGGTLLGAVRHKGYIPWDDDIDVMMPRKDYRKFIKIMDVYESDEFGINSPYQQTEQSDQPYVHAFIKFVNKKTVLIGSASTRKIKSHVYIDIFPIDGLPDSYKESEKLYKKAGRLIKLNAVQKFMPYHVKSDKHMLIRRMICAIFPQNYFFERLDKFAQRIEFDQAAYVGDIVAGYGIKERIPKTVFSNMQLLSFEGQQFCSVGDYDTYLKALYGNYMQLPPKEKQISDHDDMAYWR